MQWLSLPGMKLCLNDDYKIFTLFLSEACKEHCVSWSNGPCKSFTWELSSEDNDFDPLCCLSRGDQHSNRKDMIISRASEHVENCEGKNNRLIRKIAIKKVREKSIEC